MLTRRGWGDGERGSVIVVSLILLVVLAMASVLAEMVIGNEMVIVNRQNNAAGVAGADAGISDALFRLDQGQAATGTGPTFCVNTLPSGAQDPGCQAATVPGAPGVSYIATQVNGADWTIQAKGIVHGVPGAVQESVTRTAQFPYALFSNTYLDFNGSAPNAFATYSDSAVDSATNPNPNGPVAIGSNGRIYCNGGLGSNVTSSYYSGGGGISGNCGTEVALSTLYNLPIPQTPGSSLACPGGGQIGSANGVASLSSGTYLCTQPVTISGNLTIVASSGPVYLYIILGTSSGAALTIVRNSTVNAQAAYRAGQSLPIASNFQVLSDSNGTFGNDNGQGYFFGGIIDAPNASLTGDGCKSMYYGAIVINTLTCNGGPHLSVDYDTNLKQLYGPWVASGYQQIAPASVTIP